MRVLVIGYGNTLRGDDAAGYLVAEAVDSWDLLGVRAIALHQLTPELAVDMAEADAVYFVDAWQVEAVGAEGQRGRGAEESEELQHIAALKPILKKIEVAAAPASSDHAWTPEVLLQMARNLYGTSPTVYQILIPAVQFDYGEELSAIAQEGINSSLRTLKSIMLEK